MALISTIESEIKEYSCNKYIQRTTYVFAKDHFISNIVEEYNQYPVSTVGGTWYPPQACKFLKLKHHIHSSSKKSIIERTIKYIKDRTECFDDYFPCIKNNRYRLNHIRQWLELFVNIIKK